MQDTEFDNRSEEERRREEEERELLRKIRREVRRVSPGEADDQMREEMLEDEERRREEEELRAADEERLRRRHSSWLWQMFSGSILTRSGMSRYYKYALLIAVMFFCSILTIFNSLRLDKKFAHVEAETQLLRERSIRMQERRYRRTTHSAIVRQLRERGIDLRDPDNMSQIE